MDFIDNIKDETLIICANSVKDKILEKHILKPIKFMTLKEFYQKYYFTYDENTIMYIMNNYHVKYDIALEYLNNLYYLKEFNYEDSKLAFLANLKKELLDNDLLINNKYFLDYLKRIKLIIYDIQIDDFLLETISELDYQIIERKYHDFRHQIYEFDTMEEEVNYIAKSICKLIDEGISINDIKLTNVDSSYYHTLRRIFSLYNLKINIPYETKLISYPLVQEFIKLINELDIDEALEQVKDDSDIYDELLKVINSYYKYDNKELLIYKIENRTIKSIPYMNAIEIVNYLDYVANDNEYIFMLGFNEGIIPKYYQDTDYITDNICHELKLLTSKEKNELLRNRTNSVIKDIKNLVITYKLKDNKKSYYPSNLINNYEVTKAIDDNISYSESYDKISLISAYDNYFKYGINSDRLNILRNNYQIKYNTFDNKYKKIKRNLNWLTLSYSKMQIYNKCAFRYYLSDILKLDIFEENFSVNIGSMVHYVLEECLSNNDYDIDKYMDIYLKDKEFTKKEMFFLEKYKASIHELLDQIILEKEYMLFNEAMYEKKIDIEFDKNIHFVGVIDKILYYISDNTTYVSLIDYKTGNDEITLEYLKYGLNIQLPIYLYLSTKLPFKNIKYPGFYLQKLDIKNKDYRLLGYSNSNIDTLSIIDNNYQESKIIKGLRINKDGSFAKTSKLLSDEEIDNIKDTTESIIKNTISKIKNNEFTINPKASNGINIGCEYCKFNDICFKTVSDEVTISKEELGGEEV